MQSAAPASLFPQNCAVRRTVYPNPPQKRHQASSPRFPFALLLIAMLFPPFSPLTAIPPHSHTHHLAPAAVSFHIRRNPPGLLARLSRPHDSWPFFQEALAALHRPHVPDFFHLSQFILRHNDLLSSLRSSTHTSASRHSLQSCRRVSCTRLQTIPCPYSPLSPIHLTIAGQLLNPG